MYADIAPAVVVMDLSSYPRETMDVDMMQQLSLWSNSDEANVMEHQ